MFDAALLFRSSRTILVAAALAIIVAATMGSAGAQTTPATPAPSAGTTPSAPPAATPQTSTTPSQSNPQGIGGPDEDRSAADAQSVNLAAQPVAILAGKANWDDGFETLQDDFKKIRAEMAKAGLTAAGRPLTVFLQTDNQTFTYNAMIPVAGAQPGQTELANGITLGTSPSGKAIKFQHQGAYDDIDATYEAITAYLDEKGLESKDVFVEQYLNDASASDDPDLQVDIYIFLKE